MSEQGGSTGSLLQFAPFQSSVDEGFWHRLSSLKLNKLGIDDSPIPITGTPFFFFFFFKNNNVCIIGKKNYNDEFFNFGLIILWSSVVDKKGY